MTKQAQIRRTAGLTCAVLSAALLLGAANGQWLQRVSAPDHARTNPLLTNPEQQEKAASAGAEIYHSECAKCHGNDGAGLHARPAIVSQRVAEATDGDLFWLMTNGVPWRGMPPWNMLPASQRWQLVAYLRALNPPDSTPNPGASR